MTQQDSAGLRRNPRYESHALVEIRTSRWNPFVVESAVLIDISWDGFKVEFVGPVKELKPKNWIRMSVPLAPFGVTHPNMLKLECELRWFDARNFRCGGVFMQTSNENKILLEKIITFVAQKKHKLAASSAHGV